MKRLAILLVAIMLGGCAYHLGPYEPGALDCCRPSGKI